MPSYSFVALKKKIRTLHAEAETPISSRESHRLAQGIVLTEYAALFNTAAEAYDRDVSDETGERAVNNVLIQYLTKYGALTAPRIQVRPAPTRQHPAEPARIEITGNIEVHHPIKPTTDKGVTK